MCDVLLERVPGSVSNCDKREGVNLAKNSVTYFMDGPKSALRKKSSHNKLLAKQVLRLVLKSDKDGDLRMKSGNLTHSASPASKLHSFKIF